MISSHFIQFMMKKQCRAYEECVQLFQKSNPGTTNDFKTFCALLNRDIDKHGLKILPTICEVQTEKCVVLVNTKHDNYVISGHYNKKDVIYFNEVKNELLQTEKHKLPINKCLNLICLKSSSVSYAQDLLDKWLEDGYFVKHGSFLHFGPKFIQEFDKELRTNYRAIIHFCSFCKELVFTGKVCSLCKKLVHQHCLETYLEVNDKCVNCNEIWVTLEHDDDDDD